MGKLLGYHAIRPKHDAATDCRWRGVFGNRREVITFEAKIEQAPTQQISAHEMGQAHNQLARAEREFQTYGYMVRGTIVTHLTSFAPTVESSAGPIKVLEKSAVLARGTG